MHALYLLRLAGRQCGYLRCLSEPPLYFNRSFFFVAGGVSGGTLGAGKVRSGGQVLAYFLSCFVFFNLQPASLYDQHAESAWVSGFALCGRYVPIQQPALVGRKHNYIRQLITSP